jgi:alpha-beta hydrolase superfamily lysophospholipase
MTGTLKRNEGKFSGFDGTSLYYQDWIQPNPAKGVFIITHGQAEHSDCYNRLIKGIKACGWSFYAWDMRGHGRSDGKRGYAGRFDHYVKDYELFLDKILSSPETAGLPVILLAHSMGALVQLSYLTSKGAPSRVKAQILSAPLLAIPFAVNPLKDMAAKLAFKVYPELTLWNELKNTQLTRDQSVLAEYPKDPLRHDRISPGVYLGFLETAQIVLEKAQNIKIPTLLQLAGSDPVVSTPTAEQYFTRLGSSIKKKIVYEHALHEIYNDTIRNATYQDITEFVQPFSKNI